jgi:N6-adenosine-specific RNA methylase IME4
MVKPEPRELQLLREADRALVEATTFDEIIGIRDNVEKIQAYDTTIELSDDIILQAGAFRVKALRKMGQLLKSTNLAKGGPGNQYTRQKVNRSHGATGSLRLKDLGITKSDSSRAQQIASLPAPVFNGYVRQAIESGQEPTTAGLLRLAKQQRANGAVKKHSDYPSRFVTSLQTLIDAGQKFGTIYVDPPWAFDNQATRAAAANHYPTMTIRQIAAEPVAQLTADACHLHLWCPSAFIREAFEVMKIWGFSYSASSFTWIKPQMGTGNYWRMSHEYLLLGLKGKQPFLDHGQKSWLEADRTAHSSKPEAVRELIEKVSPGPFLEMYGRSPSPNARWTTYGNQLKTAKE